MPREQSPPPFISLSSLNTNKTIDGNPRAEEQMEVNLEVVVKMASYDPLDTKVCQKK
jgi:hypothetical protein